MLGGTERLGTVPAGTWQAVRDRLKESGLGHEEAQRAVRAAHGLWEPLRKVAQRWHASRLPGPAGTALRLLFCGMAVGRDEAVALFGEELLGACLSGGLLAQEDGRISSPFDLHFVWPCVMFGDHLTEGGEAVMVFGESTLRLYESSLPQTKTGAILDLGCGAGALAMLLSENAERTIGTDISARALELARFNAAFNGVQGVEFRQGSLFEPVRGERFDVIVGQLPYIPQFPGENKTVYRHGGSRGDELVLSAMAGLAEHLTPGGRAFFSVGWLETADDPIEHRLERALRGYCWRVLVLLSPKLELDYYVPEMTVYALGRSGPDHEAVAEALLNHLASHGASGFIQSLVVMELAAVGPEWRQMRVVPPEYWRAVRRPRIDELFQTRNLLAADDEALAASRLEPAEGAQEERTTMLDGVGIETRLRFAPTSLLEARRADVETLELLESFKGGRSPAQNKKSLPAVREALRLGLLRPATTSV